MAGATRGSGRPQTGVVGGRRRSGRADAPRKAKEHGAEACMVGGGRCGRFEGGGCDERARWGGLAWRRLRTRLSHMHQERARPHPPGTRSRHELEREVLVDVTDAPAWLQTAKPGSDLSVLYIQ